MTEMSPEERARRVVKGCLVSPSVFDYVYPRMVEAIRSAERSAYERAAKVAEDYYPDEPESITATRESIAITIRALSPPQDRKD